MSSILDPVLIQYVHAPHTLYDLKDLETHVGVSGCMLARLGPSGTRCQGGSWPAYKKVAPELEMCSQGVPDCYLLPMDFGQSR